jgi:hypothetical protein
MRKHPEMYWEKIRGSWERATEASWESLICCLFYFLFGF